MSENDPTTHPHVPLTPLTMALLLALAEGDRHGYALMRDIEEQTDGALRPGTGSLYAGLERLLGEGLICESDPAPADDRRRRTFAITERGRELARREATRMLRVLRVAAERRLAPAPEGPTEDLR